MQSRNERPVSVVFGGSSGIGEAVVRRLVARGHRVIAVARNADRLQASVARTGAEPRTCDAVDPSAPAVLFEALGAIDHLV